MAASCCQRLRVNASGMTQPRAGSEALQTADFSQLLRAACSGLPMVAIVTVMVAMVAIMVAMFPTISAFAASPTSRENTPGGGEQGDDGH